MEPRRGRWNKTAVSLPEVGTDDATAAPSAGSIKGSSNLAWRI